MIMRKLLWRCLLFLFFYWFLCVPAFAVDYDDFPSELQSILNDRIDDLDTKGGICIAGRVTMSDGAAVRSGRDVQVNLYHGVDQPLWVYDGGWFIMKRILRSSYAGPGKGIILRAFGYDPIDASVTIVDEEMTYLEFEMTKTSPEDLASVKGVVVDEDDYLFPDAPVRISFPYANHGSNNRPSMMMDTDENGQYSFEGLSICKHKVTAYALDYAWHGDFFTPPVGGTAVENRKLYPNRRIIIDYLYQADGSRSFTEGDLQTGTIDWLHGEGGVDFSQGQVEGYDSDDLRDLELRQTHDIVNFDTFYCNGKNGFYDAGAVDFDSVTQAPKSGYNTKQKQCLPGHVYIVKTYEELNYAKLIVKTNESSFRTVSPENLTPFKFPTYGLTIHFSEFNDYGLAYVRKYYNHPKRLANLTFPYYWEISGLDGLHFLAGLTVTYNENDLANLDVSEDNLALYKASYNGTDWTRLETKTDTSNNTLQVEVITSFGLFAIAAE